MILTKELRDKIYDAWSYQAATSCGWAMSELDKFALAALHKGKIKVEGYASHINDLKDFFVWKKQDQRMDEIPVLRAIPNEKLIDILNELVDAFSVIKITPKEIDINNHFFQLRLSGQVGGFDLEIGKLRNDSKLQNYIENVESVSFSYQNDKHYRLTYNVKADKLFGLFNGFQKGSIEFNRLQLR